MAAGFSSDDENSRKEARTITVCPKGRFDPYSGATRENAEYGGNNRQKCPFITPDIQEYRQSLCFYS
jgi:hypothetical protein